MMGARVFVLIQKEFTVIFQDRMTCMQLLIVPIVMLFVFSFAITMEVKNEALGVLNEDQGALGARFIRSFEAGETYSSVTAFDDPGAASRALEAQKVLMLLHIPRDFTSSLASGKPVSVLAMLDGRKSNAAQIAAGYASLTAARFGRELAAGPQFAPLIETRHLYNPNLDPTWFNQPVLLILLTQMMVILITSMSVAKERELGTFGQLLLSPLSPIEIVAGKLVPGIVLGMAEAAFMFGAATFIFGVPFVGSAALLAFVMLLFILSIASVGLAISSVCSTQQQAFLGDCLFIVPSMLLSGFVSPVENMPGLLQRATLINPTRHTLKAVMNIYLKDISAADISYEMIWMACLSLVLTAMAAWSFKNRAQ